VRNAGGHSPPFEIGVAQCFDGTLSRLCAAKGDEAKPPGPPLRIERKIDPNDGSCAGPLEHLLDLDGTRVVRQVAEVKRPIFGATAAVPIGWRVTAR
jgi:hypothetical protein